MKIETTTALKAEPASGGGSVWRSSLRDYGLLGSLLVLAYLLRT